MDILLTLCLALLGATPLLGDVQHVHPPPASPPAEGGEHPVTSRARAALAALFCCGRPPTIELETRPGTSPLRCEFSRVHMKWGPTRVQGIRLESGELDLRDLVLDTGALMARRKLLLHSVESVRYRAVITEEALNEDVDLGLGRWLSRSRLRLRDDAVELTGHLEGFVLSPRVALKGRLRVVDRRDVHFRPARLRVSILPVPRFVLEEMFRGLNPILSFDKLAKEHGLSVSIDNLIIRPGRMEVSGS